MLDRSQGGHPDWGIIGTAAAAIAMAAGGFLKFFQDHRSNREQKQQGLVSEQPRSADPIDRLDSATKAALEMLDDSRQETTQVREQLRIESERFWAREKIQQEENDRLWKRLSEMQAENDRLQRENDELRRRTPP